MIGLACLTLFACHSASALEPTRALTQSLHRIWQMQQGLPEATIYSIRQTSDGYIWLGTQSGLTRFDGVQFTPVRDIENVQLDKTWVRQLLADDDRGLWLATDSSGLFLVRNAAATHYTKADGLPSDHVRALLLDRHGVLWIGTDVGVARLANGKFVRCNISGQTSLKDVEALAQTTDGVIWAGTDNGQLLSWNGSAFVARTLKADPASGAIRALFGAKDGSLWVGASFGLFQLVGNSQRQFTLADGLMDDSIFCLTEDDHGCIYVGTQNGFSRLQHDEIENFRAQDGLSQSTVYTLFNDHEGTLWIGTKHGLNQFLDRRTIPFTASEGLPSNEVGPVFQNQAGIVWVGTLDAGLSRFDGHRFSGMTTAEGLSSNTILALAGDETGDLWIGTDRGVNRMHNGQVIATYTTKDGLPSNLIQCFFSDHQNELWIGTGGGLACLSEGKITRPAGAAGPAAEQILALCRRRDQALVFSTAGGGLYAVVKGQAIAIAQPGTPLADIDALYLDSNGLLWMGTRGGGLRVLDGDTIHTYSLQSGLYDDDIFGIVFDTTQDKFWMPCSKGIFSVSRSDLLSFAKGQITSFKSNPFSPTDGLRTIECKPGVQPGAYSMNDGKIWFATIRGVTVIDPEHLLRKLPPVPVRVEEVMVNGRLVNPQKLTDLPAGQCDLEFRYTALSFTVPTRLTFRYFLEGFDSNWVDAGVRRQAFYTNLPPGHYRFRVMAGNIDGSWTELQSGPLAFTIPPRIYQTRWFWPLSVALAVGLVLLAIRRRIFQERLRLQTILTERSRIARELHDTLMQGFSGITMEMQALSARLGEADERAELDAIIHDAGTCLREARQSITGLRTTPVNSASLAVSIEQTARQITEAKPIRLKLKLAPEPANLPPGVQYNLLRITQEAVSNSVRHSGARTIEIILDSSRQDLSLSIRDDGSGMQEPSGNGHEGGHYGLVGMKERAAQIGAELQIDSQPGQGTTVSVRLPAHHLHANNGDRT
jgi:signal transduction histidine kinase/ligand-binding sensor domain-containing protein